MNQSEVVIIGAGPAGIATALQLRRYHFHPVILEQAEIGGLLRNAYRVENYPGFPEGIAGHKLVELFKQHLAQAELTVTYEEVGKVEFENGNFVTQTDRQRIKSSYLVVATGTAPLHYNSPPIPELLQDRFYREIHPFLGTAESSFSIIGAGDAAFDYALSLARGNKVCILNRSKQLKCNHILWGRARSHQNIGYLDTITVTDFQETDGLIRVCCVLPNGRQIHIISEYVVIAIGREPNLQCLGTHLQENSERLIRDQKLFFVGDVHNGIFRQVALCVGDGVKAAMQIYHHYSSQSDAPGAENLNQGI